MKRGGEVVIQITSRLIPRGKIGEHKGTPVVWFLTRKVMGRLDHLHQAETIPGGTEIEEDYLSFAGKDQIPRVIISM